MKIAPEIEALARALCVADGNDPDKPMGSSFVYGFTTEWFRYRYQAKDIIKEFKQRKLNSLTK